MSEEELYLGQFSKGMRHGRGLLKTSECLLAGEFSDNEFKIAGEQPPFNKRGFCIRFADVIAYARSKTAIKDGAGSLFIGVLNNTHEKEGEGLEIFANGDIYIGTYEAGVPEGYGEYYWGNGAFYRGEFLSGMRHGRGKWQMLQGDSYDGEYMNDKKNGQGVYIWKNGSKYTGSFENDYRHGQGEMLWQDGRVYRGRWVNGIEKQAQIKVDSRGPQSRISPTQSLRNPSRTLQVDRRRRIRPEELKSIYNPSYQWS